MMTKKDELKKLCHTVPKSFPSWDHRRTVLFKAAMGEGISFINGRKKLSKEHLDALLHVMRGFHGIKTEDKE